MAAASYSGAVKKYIALVIAAALAAFYVVVRQQEKRSKAEADLWAEADAAA